MEKTDKVKTGSLQDPSTVSDAPQSRDASLVPLQASLRFSSRFPSSASFSRRSAVIFFSAGTVLGAALVWITLASRSYMSPTTPMAGADSSGSTTPEAGTAVLAPSAASADSNSNSNPATAPAGTSANLSAAPPAAPWSFGLVAPIELLRYKSFDGAPPFCKTPVLLFAEIRSRIAQSKSRSCAASQRTLINNSPLLEIQCKVVSPVDPNTVVHYSGMMWSERKRGTTTDYFVRGYGWMPTAAKDKDDVLFDTEADIRNEHGNNVEMESVFKECQEH